MNLETGDIILFKGKGILSALIMALPGADYSHVGMFVDHPKYGPCLFESTSLSTLPDIITGELICGVQLVPFQQRVDNYDGEVFHRPIIGERTPSQVQAVLDFIDKYHGTPYEKDNLQLARAELDIFPWHRNKPDESTLFCSEILIMCARVAALIVDDDMPANEFTPTDCGSDAIEFMNGFYFGKIGRIS